MEESNLSNFRGRLQSLAHKYFYNFKSYKVFSAIFSKGDIASLKELAKDKSIVITRPDKGKGVVILNRDIYVDKVKDLISDSAKFAEVKDSIQTYSLRIEDKVNSFLRKLKSASVITENLYKDLYVSGTGPGVLYGLPKIHKPNFSQCFQFRPIFAAYNTASYKLSKFLVPILSPLTTNSYTVKNSYNFVDEIVKVSNADSLFMASFDVENLFTNIPLSETVGICLEKLFPFPDSSVLGMTRNFFKTFLELSVMNSFFIFEQKLYKQLDGLGMGLPLGPTMANIFMCHNEEKWLADCPETFRPLFYNRYIDDTFLLFKDKTHAHLFLNYLNDKHDNIKFTMEGEDKGALSFLDVLISRENDKFVTSVYRKNTFSGLGTSYFSYMCNSFKVNALKTLVHRAYY